MLKETSARSLSGFLQEEFVRVGRKVAHGHLHAREGVGEGLSDAHRARGGGGAARRDPEDEDLGAATACISPIGETLVLSG
jgi:DNA topoisomerase VI subunit B